MKKHYTHAAKTFHKPPCDLKSLETIGNCELCGLLDHHLVFGVCPICRDKGEEENSGAT